MGALSLLFYPFYSGRSDLSWKPARGLSLCSFLVTAHSQEDVSSGLAWSGFRTGKPRAGLGSCGILSPGAGLDTWGILRLGTQLESHLTRFGNHQPQQKTLCSHPSRSIHLYLAGAPQLGSEPSKGLWVYIYHQRKGYL